MKALSNWGINYIWNGFNTTNITNDLKYLKSNGCTAIRVFIPQYDQSTSISQCQQTCLIAKSLGLFVSWGVRAGTVNGANWNLSDTVVLQQAQWFQDNMTSGMCMFEVGNEEENRTGGGLNNSQVRAHMRTLATQVKAVFNKGIVTYASGLGDPIFDTPTILDTVQVWYNEGLGGLDMVNFHFYSSDLLFTQAVDSAVSKFGQNWVLTEWGPQWGITNSNYGFIDEEKWAQRVAYRKDYLAYKMAGAKSFYYNWQGDEANGWPMHLSNGNYRTAWNFLKGGRRTLINPQIN